MIIEKEIHSTNNNLSKVIVKKYPISHKNTISIPTIILKMPFFYIA